eukprot:6176048-Pleurochrysis_carterae.AAC.1
MMTITLFHEIFTILYTSTSGAHAHACTHARRPPRVAPLRASAARAAAAAAAGGERCRPASSTRAVI